MDEKELEVTGKVRYRDGTGWHHRDESEDLNSRVKASLQNKICKMQIVNFIHDCYLLIFHFTIFSDL